MGLFLHETTSISAPTKCRVSVLAAVSLIVAVTGFVNLIGFFVGPVLAHIALIRVRAHRRQGVSVSGRGLAIAALWISYGAVVAACLILAIVLIAAYAALPRPQFF